MAVQILVGDVRDMLRGIPDDSMDCVVTSPPYWGLRDYGVAGQLGLEPTLGEHIATMVDVFREIRRVMTPTATLWLNYGDCYATTPNGRSAADTKAAGTDDRTFRDKPFSTIGPINPPQPGQPFPEGVSRRGGGNASDSTLKPKDLCMIPNRLAIALQEDGWWVRSEIIWAKPNPMPESTQDRPGTAHEKVFMLTKSARYFYDIDAVRVPFKQVSINRLMQPTFDSQQGGPKDPGTGNRSQRKALRNQREKLIRGEKWKDRHDGWKEAQAAGLGRNIRNYEPAPMQVWEIGILGFRDAHFATFPPELVERCLLAGCPEGGTVLDPFGGAGTTGLVADRMRRNAVLIELNPEYAEMARARIDGDGGRLFEAVDVQRPGPSPASFQPDLLTGETA